jgi:phage terminase large subunit
MATAFATAADILDANTARYRPRGGAKQAYEATETEILISGSAGTGKSRACLERIHRLATDYPGAQFLICRKTLASLATTAIVTLEEHVIRQQLEDGTITYFGGSRRKPASYNYANGSRIALGGLDNTKAIAKIMSSEYDGVFVQEAVDVRLDDWEKLTTRLRNGRVPHMQIIGDTNPDRPDHWLLARAQAGTLRLIESRHEDNPILYNEDGTKTVRGQKYMALLDKLTGIRLQRLRFGLWVAAEGIIYEDWDPAVHLIDRFSIPAHWPRIWGIDFGHTHPFVWQNWAIDDDGRIYLTREIFHTKRLVEDHARRVVELTTREPAPIAVVCDHDAEGRATFEKHAGVRTVPAKKNVLDGLEAVMARLRKADDGKRRMYIFRDAVDERDEALIEASLPTCTAEEIPGYIWATGVDGKPGKEQPVKELDDGVDCGRYVIAELDLAHLDPATSSFTIRTSAGART